MTSKLDITAMYAMHNALRRELEHLARITASSNDDPRHILRTAAGWELLKQALHIHHTSEDDSLWPAMRQALASRPDDLALLDAMEEALPLIGATVTLQQWQHFGQVHASRTGADTPRMLPWLLECASDETIATMLAPLPEPVRLAYHNEWQPAHAALNRWHADTAADDEGRTRDDNTPHRGPGRRVHRPDRRQAHRRDGHAGQRG
jgi:hypothetical protein